MADEKLNRLKEAVNKNNISKGRGTSSTDADKLSALKGAVQVSRDKSVYDARRYMNDTIALDQREKQLGFGQNNPILANDIRAQRSKYNDVMSNLLTQAEPTRSNATLAKGVLGAANATGTILNNLNERAWLGQNFKDEQEYKTYQAYQKALNEVKDSDGKINTDKLTMSAEDAKQTRNDLNKEVIKYRDLIARRDAGELIPNAENLDNLYDDAQKRYNKARDDYSNLRQMYANEISNARIADTESTVRNSSNFDDLKGYREDSNYGEEGYINRIVNGVSTYNDFYDSEDVNAENAKAYQYMTDAEKEVYNYFYNSGDYKAAKDYLDSIQSNLNQRRATSDYESKYEGKYWKETLSTLPRGITSSGEGISNALYGLFDTVMGNERIPTTSYNEYLSSMASQDLKQNAPKRAVVSDVLQSTGNMAGAFAFGMGNPIAFVTALGTGAGGQAYAEAKRNGYNNKEAIAYGTITGLSEALLERLLGGIEGVGENLIAKGVSKLIPQSVKDNIKSMAVTGTKKAILETITKYGADAFGEFSEEYLQEVLDPVYRNILLGENNDIEFFTADAFYAGVLGALTSGLINTPAIASSAYNTSRNFKAYQNTKNDVERKQDLIDLAEMTLPEESPERKILQERTADNITSKELESLVFSTSKATEGLSTQYLNTNRAEMLDKAYKGMSSKVKSELQKIAKESGNEVLTATQLGMMYNAGQSQVNYTDAYNSIGGYGVLTSDQAERAYILGTQNKVNTEDSKIFNETFNKLKMGGSVTLVTPEEAKRLSIENHAELDVVNMDTLSKRQRAAIKYLNVLADSLGVNFKLYNSSQGEFDPNGMYNSDTSVVYLDINAGSHNEEAILRTAGHELTHHIKAYGGKAWTDYSNFIREFYDTKTFEAMVEKEMQLAKDRKRAITKEKAEEEVIANASEMMLRDTKVIDKIMAENRTLGEKIKAFIDEFVEKLHAYIDQLRKAGFNGVVATHTASRILGKSVETFEIAQEMWDNALISASKNYAEGVKPIGEAIVNGDTEATKKFTGELATESEVENASGGEVMNSLRNDAKLMEASETKNIKLGNVSYQNMAKAKAVRNRIKTLLETDRIKQFLPEDIEGNVVEGNSAYGGKSIENSMVCIRSIVSNYYIDEVSKELGRPLTVEEQIAVSQVLANYTGEDIECIYCYVRADRMAYREYLGTYYKQYSDLFDKVLANRDAYKKSIGMGNKESNKLYYDFLAGRANTDPMWKRYVHFVEDGLRGEKSLSESDLTTPEIRQDAIKAGGTKGWLVNDSEAYAQGASWQKSMNHKPVSIDGKKVKRSYLAYNGNILKFSKKLIEKLNASYGLRMYSFSDYTPAYLLENMQEVTDAAVMGLKMLAYTKDVGFAKVFAPTGMGINVSVFGVMDENGNVIEDAMQGAKWADAKAIRNEYDNVGTVFVATNDKLVEWAMDQDWIDVVIPYHTVRTGTKIAEYFGFKDYKGEQEDKKTKEHTSDMLKNIPPTIHMNDQATYESALDRNKLTARFEKWKKHPNYMKLVNETRMPYNKLQPVQPIFDLNESLNQVERIAKEGTYGIKGMLSQEQQNDYLKDHVSEGVEAVKNLNSEARHSTSYSERVLMGSMFSGGGTLEAGLEYQMLDKEFAVENNKKIAAVYTDNHGKEHMFVGDVRDFDSKKKQNVFYLHASPVCKNFSNASNTSGETTLDITTAEATARVLEEQMPEAFTVENVKRYIGSEAYNIITNKLDELGYDWDVDVYKASDYGNATKRERMIIRAVKDGKLPPKPTKVKEKTSWYEATKDLFETDLIPSTLVRSKIDAINNTPGLSVHQVMNSDKPVLIYDTTKSKQITYSLADDLAPTLTTKCGDARIIWNGRVYAPTPKFMGRLQGLPDDYKYPKEKSTAFKVIGNGIPTQLTNAVMGGVLDSAYEQTHNGGTLYQERTSYAPTFYSSLAKTIDGIKTDKIGADSVVSYLKGKGIKDEEIKWSGIESFVEGKKSVTKAELQEFARGSMLDIEEESLNSNGNEEKYIVPETQEAYTKDELQEAAKAYAKENGYTYEVEAYTDYVQIYYFEDDQSEAVEWQEFKKQTAGDTKWSEYKTEGGKNYREILFKMPGSDYSNSAMANHWGKKGVLAHARIQDMITSDGKKMLFVDEIQSDWHNAGHNKGYADKESVKIGKAYYTLRNSVSERMSVYAQGFKSYAKWFNEITKEAGIDLELESKNGRYYLWNMGMLELNRDDYSEFRQLLFDYLAEADYEANEVQSNVPDAPLKNTYTDFVMKRLIREAAENGYDSIGWTTGKMQEDRWSSEYAEGYRIEYDQEIPKFMNKYGKKWGGKVTQTTLESGDSVWAFEIPETMKDSVLYEGQPMYQERTETSTRSLLANALETTAQNDAEKSFLADYKSKIATLDAKSKELFEVNKKIHEYTFGQNKPSDYKSQLVDLKAKAKGLSEAINAMDKKLLNLESTQILKNVVRRANKATEKRVSAKYHDMAVKNAESKSRTEIRNQIKKMSENLNKRLEHPKGKSYVPVELVRGVISVMEELNKHYDNYDQRIAELEQRITEAESQAERDHYTDILEKTKASQDGFRDKLKDLAEMYDSYKGDPDYDYSDPIVADMLKEVTKRLKGKNLYTMSLEDLKAVRDTLTALNHTIVNAVSVIDNGVRGTSSFGDRTTHEVGRKMVREVMNSTTTKPIADVFTKGVGSGWINATLRVSNFFNRISGFTKDGDVMKVYDMLNDGQTKKLKFIQAAYGIFNELIPGDNYKNVKALSDTKNLVSIDGLVNEAGENAEITRGMMLSIYMHLLNEDNRKHMMYGGLTVPDIRQYYNGNIKGSLSDIGTTDIRGTNRELAQIGKELNQENLTDQEREELFRKYKKQLDEANKQLDDIRDNIESQLTEWERMYIKAAQRYFDSLSKDAINETTMALYGFKRARVMNYFPIHSDKRFIIGETNEGIKVDKSLENAGWLKDRVYSGNKMILEDINNVIMDQIESVGTYVGMAIPNRNYNKMKKAIESENGVDKNFSNIVGRVWGKEAAKYLENFEKDLVGARTGSSDRLPFVDALRGNLAGATLTWNPRVIIGQAASYNMIASVLGWDATMKALVKGGVGNTVISRADRAQIAEWTPLLWYRNQGNSTQELGDLNNSNTLYGKSKEWLQSHKATELIGKSMDLIQKMDTATVGRIWYAAQYYVQDEGKYTVGTDEYWEEVARMFNKAVYETQPNYTMMQRPDILRNKNEFVKFFTMYKTQSLQNYNVLYDAFGRYNRYRLDFKEGKNGVTAEDVKRAAKSARDSALAVGVSNAVYVSMRFLAGMLIANGLANFRDDDDELTAKSIALGLGKEYMNATLGMILWGDYLYDLAKSIATQQAYTGLDISVLSELGTIVNRFNAFTKSLEDGEPSIEDVEKAWKLTSEVMKVVGFPTANAEKIVKGTVNNIKDIANGTRFEAGIDRTYKQEAHRFYNAYVNGDTKKMSEILDGLNNTSSAKSQFTTYFKQLLSEGVSEAEIRKCMKATGLYGSADDIIKLVNKWKEQ